MKTSSKQFMIYLKIMELCTNSFKRIEDGWEWQEESYFDEKEKRWRDGNIHKVSDEEIEEKIN